MAARVLFQGQIGRGVNQNAVLHVVRRLRIVEMYLSSLYWIHGAGRDLLPFILLRLQGSALRVCKVDRQAATSVLLLPEFCCITLTSQYLFGFRYIAEFQGLSLSFMVIQHEHRSYTLYSVIASTGYWSVPLHGQSKNNTTLTDVSGMQGARGGVVG